MSEMREYIVVKLKEMGFDEAKIERACNSTTCESLDQVMEWIITESEREFNPPPSGSSSSASTPAATVAAASADASASKSHQDSNSTDEKGASESKGSDETVVPVEEKKVKTAEEIEAEKKKLEDKIKQRRLLREEEERKQEIEKEKKRRETGSEISKYRERFETQEKIRIAQELRKEKLEREAHKKAVLEQIKKDREAMKRENQTNTSLTPSTSGSTPSKVINTGSSSSGSNANECKLAIRLPDGSSLVQKFNPNEKLAAVRLFIQLNRKDLFGPDSTTQPFKLQMPPNKAFTQEDMDRSLMELGLCPSARLFLTDIKSTRPL